MKRNTTHACGRKARAFVLVLIALAISDVALAPIGPWHTPPRRKRAKAPAKRREPIKAWTWKKGAKVADADFWVVFLWTGSRYGWRYSDELPDSWNTGMAGSGWAVRAARCKAWNVCYARPGDASLQYATLERPTGGIPSRDEIRRTVHADIAAECTYARRPPAQLKKLVGRYHREKLRKKLPKPLPERW